MGVWVGRPRPRDREGHAFTRADKNTYLISASSGRNCHGMPECLSLDIRRGRECLGHPPSRAFCDRMGMLAFGWRTALAVRKSWSNQGGFSH